MANDSSTSNVILDETDDKNPRYIGASPNNYVQFYDSDIVWRIIGVFNGEVKLESNNNVGRKNWNDIYSNNWAESTLQQYLNGDEYYEKLSSETKLAINKNHVWNLGGIDSNFDKYTAQNTAQNLYTAERSTTVKYENPKSWLGRIALIYPSDFVFATSGGENTTRDQCINNSASENNEYWGINMECTKNDWLRLSPGAVWTLTPTYYSNGNIGAITLLLENRLSSDGIVHDYYIQPTIYLKSDTNYIQGVGSEQDPYIVKS